MDTQAQFCTVEEALEELRSGRLIITIDDPDRENEGDLICAAQFATTENVNFMAVNAKGLICTPMSQEVADRLGLEQMVKVNTDNHCHRLHRLHRPRGHHHRHLRPGAGLHLPQVRGPGHPAGGPAPARPRLPPGGPAGRRAGPQRPHRGHRGPVPPGGAPAVRPVLRDHAGRRHHDAHHRAAGKGTGVGAEGAHHPGAPGLLPPPRQARGPGGRGQDAHQVRRLPDLRLRQRPDRESTMWPW